MKEFKFHIPVEGMITVPIVAENIDEAIQIILDKKEQLGNHPLGKLDLQINRMLAVDANPKIVN